MATCIVLALAALFVTMFVTLSSAIPSPLRRTAESYEPKLSNPLRDLSSDPPRRVSPVRPQLPPEILAALNRRLDKAA